MSSDKKSTKLNLAETEDIPQKTETTGQRTGGQSGGTSKTGQLKTVGGDKFSVGQSGGTSKTGQLKIIGSDKFSDS